MSRPGLVVIAISAFAGLLACAPPDIPSLSEPGLVNLTEVAPPGAAPGTCWGKAVEPAIIETITDQVMMQPPQIMADGTVTQPAIYKTETRQQIVKERRETWFETPCAGDVTPEFVASLQRALKVRKHYSGPITGEMDARTRTAIRRYQAPQGLDSGILSLAAARQLGLTAVAIAPPT